MQTILGAGGAIGRDLAKELKKYTDRVRLVSRNPERINADDELMAADLTRDENIDRAVAGSEVVYLTVGLEYKTSVWQREWPRLVRHVIEACKKHGARLVFFDNMYMYDPAALGHMTEDAPLGPVSKKGQVRAELQRMILNQAEAGRLQALIARSADFYGPNISNSMLLETVYKNLKKGRAGMWLVDADKQHSFTYTPDAAAATALLGNTPDAYGQIWHLPTAAPPLTPREMTALFAKELGVKPKLTVVPRWLLRIMGVFSPFLRELPEMTYQNERNYVFDSSKFTERFSFVATPYEEGVREVVQADR